MKKLLFLFFLTINSLIYGANVYFDLPSNGQSYTLLDGRAGVSYHIMTVSFFYVCDWYGANARYPDGSWTGWESGQGGGWVFSQPGTYMLQGAVHVVSDLSGRTDYYMYSSNYISFTVVAAPPPPQPLSAVSISGPTNFPYGVNETWNASLTNGIAPFNYSWYYEYSGSGGAIPVLSSNTIRPNLPPVNTWYSIGSNSPSLTSAFAYYPYGILLKCVVTDASSTTVTSNILTLYPTSAKIAASGPEEKFSGKFVSEQSEIESVSSYALAQNSPNPFNPSTIISYQLPNDGFVSLKVFDILGREIKTLVNEVKNQGKYSVRFDATNLTSGIYFYQLKSGSYTSIKKMILTK